MKLDWPEYPRVSIKDETILILFENGKTLFWGIEEDPAKSEKVILDIQEGLRAIKFLSDSLEEFVKSLFAFLARARLIPVFSRHTISYEHICHISPSFLNSLIHFSMKIESK